MTNAVVDAFDRVRQPEYTGENRCIPCTIANVAIAAVLSVVVGVVSIPAGAAVFLASLALVYLRGYLVPGTPELTKRYFPDWLLALFDKRETHLVEPGEQVDVERVLVEGGVLQEHETVDDLVVAPWFEEQWFEEIERARGDDASRAALADLLGIDPESLSFQEFGEAFSATSNGSRVGHWESRAAFLADVAAARVLADELDGWASTTPAQRGQLLNGLRLFLEECPSCGGAVRFGQEVVQSCCRSVDVVAVTCEDCDARLFEMETPEIAAA
ncbi:MAG: hypothetical protein ABEJ23_00970 [Haloarculaceae archaeon]